MNNVRLLFIWAFFLFIIPVFYTDLVAAEPVILLEIEDPPVMITALEPTAIRVMKPSVKRDCLI